MVDLLDRLKEQVSAGITTVTTKSRVAVETTRLRRQMRRLTQEKTDALIQLGARAYQELSQHGHWEQESMHDAIKHIQELDRTLAELEQEITRLEAQAAAPPWPAGRREQPLTTCTCGAPLSEGILFCGACGSNVQALVAQAAAAHCPRCEAGIPATAKFCWSCGAIVPERPEATSPPALQP